MMKKLAGATLALAVAGLGLLSVSPAHAEDGHYPAAGWQMQDTTIGADVDWSDCDPGPVRVDAALSTVVDATTVDLVGTGVAAPPHHGTSIETTNLGIDVAAGDVVSVDYELVGDASAASGAVRLFIYDHADGDTDCEAPTAFVAAPDDESTSGTLSLTADFAGTIGTAGLVYDSSNGGVGGTVQFSGLTVGDTSVVFVAPPEPCEWDKQLTADDEGCQEPASPSPSATPSPEASESPEPEAAGAGGGADEELPLTGSSVLPVAGVGLVLLLVGGVIAFVLRRKRRPLFTLPTQ